MWGGKMNKEDIFGMIGMFLAIMFFIGIGMLLGSFLTYELFECGECYGERSWDGCWKQVTSGGVRSDWVCVNVYGMSYNRAMEVCAHEVGHEMVAEECEKNFTKCLEVMG